MIYDVSRESSGKKCEVEVEMSFISFLNLMQKTHLLRSIQPVCTSFHGNPQKYQQQQHCSLSIQVSFILLKIQLGGGFNSTHLQKKLVKLDHFPRLRGENKKKHF